jgi:hypothetical protein
MLALFAELIGGPRGAQLFRKRLKTKGKAVRARVSRRLARDWWIEKSALHRICQAVVCSCTRKDSSSVERSIFCTKAPDIVDRI